MKYVGLLTIEGPGHSGAYTTPIAWILRRDGEFVAKFGSRWEAEQYRTNLILEGLKDED